MNSNILMLILIICVICLIFPNYFSNFEMFGQLSDNGIPYQDNLNIGLGVSSSKFGVEVTNLPTADSEKQNPDYNNLNNVPKLVLDNGNGYFQNRIKIIDNPNSPLMKLYEQNQEEVYRQIKSCDINKKLESVDKTGIGGYNMYPYLGEDSYANITAIGKTLLTPYVSFPQPASYRESGNWQH